MVGKQCGRKEGSLGKDQEMGIKKSGRWDKRKKNADRKQDKWKRRQEGRRREDGRNQKRKNGKIGTEGNMPKDEDGSIKGGNIRKTGFKEEHIMSLTHYRAVMSPLCWNREKLFRCLMKQRGRYWLSQTLSQLLFLAFWEFSVYFSCSQDFIYLIHSASVQKCEAVFSFHTHFKNKLNLLISTLWKN